MPFLITAVETFDVTDEREIQDAAVAAEALGKAKSNDAIQVLIDDPDASIDEIIDVLPGPDFPTGGLIVGREGIKSAYETGRGRVIMQARIGRETRRGGPSYTIDTVLLTAAFMLATLLRQYPFVHDWLTAKVVLLVVYIALGTFALKRARSQRTRTLCFVAAIVVYLFILK